jgi:TRAP transporter TAXI family solute receptor
MKKIYAVLLSVLLLAGLAGLAEAQRTPAPPKVTFISFGGGPAGGLFNTLATTISKVVNDNLKEAVNITVTGTGGGAENIVRVDRGEFELGITDGMSMFQAYRGEDAFKGQPRQNLRAVGIVIAGAVHAVTLERSEIRTLADLAGKRVALGTPGSSSALINDAVLKELDLRDKMKPTFILGRTAATSLRDGHLDAYMWTTAIPSSVEAELAASQRIRLLDVMTPLKKTDFMRQHPYSWEGVLRAGTYGAAADVPMLMTGIYWVTNRNVDEELVYRLTKAVYDNVKSLAELYGPMRFMTLENVLQGLTIPLHPGAQRYFVERGVKIPETVRAR